MKNIKLKILLTWLFALTSFQTIAHAQTTAFTYQGKLSDGAQAASGTYDFGFALYDAETGGNLIGAAITRSNVSVSGGIFTVQLDFTQSAFPGANRFLQIAVKKTTETNFTTLTTRQPVASTPYAIRAVSATAADTATNASNLGGTAANQFVQTGDTRLFDARMPTAGSANYIQNATTAQTSANFNIGGTGEANIFNAGTQFNIGGSRVLFTDGIGGANTFVGLSAGRVNTGSLNFFAGFSAGSSNAGGSSNAFVGAQAGQANTSGNFNAFFGRFAGSSNTTGDGNSFLGSEAGVATTNGANNAFVGAQAGRTNITGGNNSALGAFSNFSANNLNFASAIGSFAAVSANDTIVIGKTAGTYSGAARPADAVLIPGTLAVAGTLTAGKVTLDGGVLARGGAPGAFGANNNGYAFGSGGDEDGGLFSTANGQVSLYTNSAERVRVTDAGVQFNVPLTGNGSGLTNLPAANVTGVLAIANGGTGSSTQNFVDLTTAQTIQGNKTFTGFLRSSGLLRAGSETGTSEAPTVFGEDFGGLVVRRINSTDTTAGSVIARTDNVRLERDGTNGGLRVSFTVDANNRNVYCLGMNDVNGSVNSRVFIGTGAAGSKVVYTDEQNVVFVQCSFGDAVGPRHMTQVTMQRDPQDSRWVGTVTSTQNQ